MVSNSVTGVGLLLVATLFYSAGYAWISLATVMVGGVMIFSGGSKKVSMPAPPRLQQPVQTVVGKDGKKPELDSYWWSQDKWNKKFPNVTDMKFRPSIPPDGIAGIGATGPSPVNFGKRTGQLSIYTGNLRFKNDIRFMPEFCYTDPLPFKNLITTHFRTRPSPGQTYLDKVKPLDSTFEQLEKGIFDDQGWFD